MFLLILFKVLSYIKPNSIIALFRMSEIGIIKLLSQRSEKVIAIIDSSKIGKCSKQKVLNLDNIDLLLTDDNISPILKEKYKNKCLLIE